jgi:putative transposase
MPKPLSNDLRKRIIEAKRRGETESKIAAEKEVCQSTVTKRWALYRETGSHAPRANPNGRKPALSKGPLEAITHKIGEQPDITLTGPSHRLSAPSPCPRDRAGSGRMDMGNVK